MLLSLSFFLLAAAPAGASSATGKLPAVAVDRDDTSLTTSCTVVIRPGQVIPDSNGDGAIHVDADDITVERA